MDTFERHSYRTSATSMTGVAHLLGVIALILTLVWLLHYREGIELDSDNPSRVFNVHPFLMICGLIFFSGEAAMAYNTVRAARNVQKFTHMLLNLIAIVLGIVGLCAAFKFHNMKNLKHMTSLHSWIGMGTICLFCLQWVLGLTLFLFPKASQRTRARALPWHICGGKALLYMAVCAAVSGLMQKELLQNLGESRELHLINFTGLAVLLFGITVDLSISLGRFVL